MTRPDPVSPVLSSVELHRKGELEHFDYDFTDSLDLAIWTSLQSYVGYLETAGLEVNMSKRGTKGCEVGTIYEVGATEPLTVRSPGELEGYMLRLRNAEVGESDSRGSDERFSTALRVLEGLSLPIWDSSGRRLGYGDGDYRIRRNLWGAGELLLEKSRGPNLVPGFLGKITPSKSPPLLMPERVAALFALLVRSLGRLVSQSEAARRAGLTPRGMALRIQREGIQRVRVGQYVFIREDDVERLMGLGES